MYYDPNGHSAIVAICLLIASFAIGFGISAIAQGCQYGWDNINYGQCAIDGLFAAISTGLAMTGIGVVGATILGGVNGFLQYYFDSLVRGEDITLAGSLASIGIGALIGRACGAGARHWGTISSKMMESGWSVNVVNAISSSPNKSLLVSSSLKALQSGSISMTNVAFHSAPLVVGQIIQKNILVGFLKADVGLVISAIINGYLAKIIG